jgi:hypothetical protein
MRLFIYLLVSCHCHELVLAFTARPARCSAGTNHCRPYTGATPIRDSSAPSDTAAQQLPSALVELQSDDDSSSSSSSALEITISRAPQPRVEASVAVKLLGGAVSGKVTVRARLEVESDLRLRETYESVTVLGQASPYSIPSQLQYARDLYVTYLDDDLLVVRDGSGVPEVLVRKAKKFSRNWGTEPSAINDMVPPGDGEDAQF